MHSLGFLAPVMTLKVKFFLATAAAVLLLVTVSEWVTYRQTASFLSTHEAMMRHGPDGAALLTLRTEKRLLLLKLTALRLLNAAAAMIGLMVVLNVLWRRLVASPMRVLLRHIDWMSRGTWKTPVSIHRKDEMGELARAFNDLGEQLTVTVQQFAATSKLSALALIGQRVMQRTEAARARMAEVKGVLAQAVRTRSTAPPDVLPSLNEAIEILGDLEAHLESDFYKELHACGTSTQEQSGGNATTTAPAPQRASEATISI